VSKILVISFPEDFLICCSGTIIQQLENHNEVILLIIKKQKASVSVSIINEIKKNIKSIKIEILQKLDLSAITQDNVNHIQNFINKYNPDLVIIPFNKSKDVERRVLGDSSILACKRISNILMYDVQENPLFMPSIFYNITNNIEKKQQMCTNIKNGKAKQNFMKLTASSNIKNKITDVKGKFFEPYQSLRIILDSDVMRNFC
jgi:hypothetical protein